MSFDVVEFYERKAAWSREVFGPQQRVEGVIAHLRKELAELRAAISKPDRQIGDVSAICEELADVCLLAIDLSWRAGGTATDFRQGTCARITLGDAADYIGRHLDSAMPPTALAAVVWDIAFRALGCDGAPIEQKFAAIQKRRHPDWRTIAPDQPIEHVRDEQLDTESVVAALVPASPVIRPRVAELEAERAEWRGDNDRLRAERQRVREILGARPDETVEMAARRVAALAGGKS